MQAFPSYIILILYTVFAVVIGFNYFESYPIPGFFIKLAELILGILFVLISILLGKKILKYIGNLFDFELENTIFSFIIGVSIISLAMFAIGMSGLYYKTIIWIIILIILIISYKDALNLLKSMNISVRNAVKPDNNYTLTEIILIILSIFSIIMMFVVSFAPPTYYDSLTYHLAIPGIYIKEHKILQIPFNIYSNFPQNMEMLYTFGLLIGDEILPNLISLSMTIFTIIGIFSFCRRFFNKDLGMFSVVLFSTTTAVMLLGSGSYVEAGLAFFSFYSIYCFILYIEKNTLKLLILSGFLSGMAVGVKYTGAITPAILCIIAICYFIYNKKYSQIKYMALFLFIVFIVFLPWAVKNIVNTGNPVFPFLYKTIGYKNIAWTSESAANYFSMLVEYKHKSTIIEELFTFPFKLVNTTLKYGSGIDVLGDFGWVLYLLLLPAIVLTGKLIFPLSLLFLYILGHFGIWFSGKPVLRFLYPLLPVLAIVCSYIYQNIQKRKIIILRYLFPVMLFLLIASNYFIYFFVQSIIEPFGAAIGTESKESFLNRKIKLSPYAVFDYINKNLEETDKILFIGEERGFYCEKKYIATNVFGKNQFTADINEAKNVNKLIEIFRERGITHILYNEKEGEKIRCYGIFDFNDNGKKIWKNLFKNLNLLISNNKVQLYQI